MSDPTTDMKRDEWRQENYEAYLDSLIGYLQDPTEENYDVLLDSAKKTDGVKRGYFSSRTKVSEGLDEFVESLQEGDRRNWMNLLKNSKRLPQYDTLKDMSPFEGILLDVHYGVGFIELDSKELEDLITEKIREGDYMTHDCDYYGVVLNIGKDDIEFYWLENGTPGVNSPRDKDGDYKE